jgi:hypothetical protein
MTDGSRPHPIWGALLGSTLVVTIDRIEADVAVVEWTEGLWSAVPVALLPVDTSEGDRLRIEWTREPPPPPRALPAESPLPDFLSTPHGVESPPSSDAPACASSETQC